jgi:diguanylate cyclase (GGDEF)-like protein
MNIIEELTCRLNENGRGVNYIYSSMESLCQFYGLSDITAVVDSGTGGQIFSLNDGIMTPDRAVALLSTTIPALYSEPDVIPDSEKKTISAIFNTWFTLEKALHNASHDSLTGLSNRRHFEDQLQLSCYQSDRYGWPFALVLIDVNDFKIINDTKGHLEGDRVLRDMAGELKLTLRGGDIAARIGGDEFALILSNANYIGASQVVKRLRKAVSNIYEGAGISVGIVCSPQDGTDSRLLYALADGRLYEDKTK